MLSCISLVCFLINLWHDVDYSFDMLSCTSFGVLSCNLWCALIYPWYAVDYSFGMLSYLQLWRAIISTTLENLLQFWPHFYNLGILSLTWRSANQHLSRQWDIIHAEFVLTAAPENLNTNSFSFWSYGGSALDFTYTLRKYAYQLATPSPQSPAKTSKADLSSLTGMDEVRC